MTNYDILKEYETHKTPVPSYEEWIGVKQQRDLENKLRHDSDNRNWQLRTENAQLKELLKEIRDSIAESQLKLTPEGFKLITEIVAKINEALR